MVPYQIVFDRVSDNGILQYILNDGVNRTSLVSLLLDSFPISLGFTDVFLQISDIAEGLGYLHSQNIVHGRLRGVGYQLHFE